MLLGARLMPDLDGPAAIELAYGDTAQVRIARADGTESVHEGTLDSCRIPREAIRIGLKFPDSRLREWSFLEVNLSPAGPQQIALLKWMAQQSDIAIWCTEHFDDRERSLWSHVPDTLKDHSFLALTRADRLFMKGELNQRIARLSPVVADEFLGLYPVAVPQGAAARSPGGQQNDALWQSSGAKALVGAIRKRVDQARTISLDRAFMLLERYKAALADLGKVEATAPAAQPSEAVASPRPVAVAETAARMAPHKADTETVIRKALRVLQSCARDLATFPDAANASVADQIMQRCGTTAEALVQLFSDAEGTDPEVDALKNDAVDGEQMLMLLRLERGETAAEDSLTVLLQLKKEMTERIAR
jgi:hypothetical protein